MFRYSWRDYEPFQRSDGATHGDPRFFVKPPVSSGALAINCLAIRLYALKHVLIRQFEQAGFVF